MIIICKMNGSKLCKIEIISLRQHVHIKTCNVYTVSLLTCQEGRKLNEPSNLSNYYNNLTTKWPSKLFSIQINSNFEFQSKWNNRYLIVVWSDKT